MDRARRTSLVALFAGGVEAWGGGVGGNHFTMVQRPD